MSLHINSVSKAVKALTRMPLLLGSFIIGGMEAPPTAVDVDVGVYQEAAIVNSVEVSAVVPAVSNPVPIDYLCMECVGYPELVPGIGYVWVHHYEHNNACYEDGAEELCNFCDQDPDGCHEFEMGSVGNWCDSPVCGISKELIAEITTNASSRNVAQLASSLRKLSRPPDVSLSNGTISLRGCDDKVVARVAVSKDVIVSLASLPQ